MRDKLPAIGVMMGDRHGIGPEVTARFLADARMEEYGRTVLFADPAVVDFGQKTSGVGRLPNRLAECHAPAVEPAGMGRATAAAGAEVLRIWDEMLRAAVEGEIDGIVYAPVLP